MKPLVLALPVFNAERFLPATLTSLQAQGTALRWWLQDGGSSDQTTAIARGLARPGDVVCSQRDHGQADALNRAFEKMGGEIIGFINGDDLLLPDAAERVLEHFDLHPEIDLVCGGIEWIDENGVVKGEHHGRIGSLEEALNIFEVWWGGRQWVQPEVFYRRSLWERAGAFDIRYRLAFDYDFWVRCFEAGARVASIPEPLAQFRRHAAQKSAAAAEAAAEIRQIAARHLASGAAGRVSGMARRRLAAGMAYDRYANAPGEPAGGSANASSRGAGSPFWRALLTHPEWLLCPAARNRLSGSLRQRLRRGGESQNSNPC